MDNSLPHCCSSATPSKATQKHTCPQDGKAHSQVSIKTILHHMKSPWHWPNSNQRYYFCSDPNCEVVYFGQDNSIITQADLLTTVGIKHPQDNAALCYCFDISYKEARLNKHLKHFVQEKTKNKLCACDVRNPSGKCCLKDFPKT
ncbi:MAG: copper chaperone Copz family protein [Methylococcales bacterium]|jgi:hypothetical protein|nr:copper chaperone Copz family protein [Methylococcales bacterium]MBT7445327.1 copper chaperone Copz family protein [Methylococcales bacterium]